MGEALPFLDDVLVVRFDVECVDVDAGEQGALERDHACGVVCPDAVVVFLWYVLENRL